MVRRHPHVFSKSKVKSVEEVWKKWEEIKGKENAEKGDKHIGILKASPMLSRRCTERIKFKEGRQGWDSIGTA